jgi:hypothetical protein
MFQAILFVEIIILLKIIYFLFNVIQTSKNCLKTIFLLNFLNINTLCLEQGGLGNVE